MASTASQIARPKNRRDVIPILGKKGPAKAEVSGIGLKSLASASKVSATGALTSEIEFIPNRKFIRWLSVGSPISLQPTAVDRESCEAAPRDGRLSAHYERMCGVRLLTPAEEKSLFCRMNFLRYQANRLRIKLRRKRVAISEEQVLEGLLSEACEIRNRIVHANVRLVVSIARQVANSKNSMDDLVSEGVTCMMKAVDKFDFDRGFRFSTYATRSIRRELWRFIQKNHKLRGRWITSLDDQVMGEESPATPESIPFDELSSGHVPDDLKAHLTRLDARERFIIDARFGFTNLGKKPTFQTLGKLLGVSKERARQLEQRAMTKLRELFGVAF